MFKNIVLLSGRRCRLPKRTADARRSLPQPATRADIFLDHFMHLSARRPNARCGGCPRDTIRKRSSGTKKESRQSDRALANIVADANHDADDYPNCDSVPRRLPRSAMAAVAEIKDKSLFYYTHASQAIPAGHRFFRW
jgi:hypothetical protein